MEIREIREIRELWVIGKNRYMWQKWGTVVGANAWEADELGNLGLGSFRGLGDSGVWELREFGRFGRFGCP